MSGTKGKSKKKKSKTKKNGDRIKHNFTKYFTTKAKNLNMELNHKTIHF